MCTIAILIEIVEGAPLVLAANRDELYARPTRPPEVLGPGLAGGVDVLSGGTWLALRRDGQFAAVTNQRALATPPPGLRSRGHAVRELAAADDPDAYAGAIDPAMYASMNLVWRGAHGIMIAYSRHDTRELVIEPLARGIHVLCNDRLGADGFPRGDRLAAAIATMPLAWPALRSPLATALGDHTRVSLAATPPSHLPVDLARELTATCIHSEAYGTRSATIVAADRTTVIDYLHADGPPCVTPFVDRRSLLA
ncbi:MAG: NRDE family protein [Kofleriaceae bacterium]